MTPTFQPRVEPEVDFEEARKIAVDVTTWVPSGPSRARAVHDLEWRAADRLGTAYLALLARAEAAEERERGLLVIAHGFRVLYAIGDRTHEAVVAGAEALAEHHPEAGAQ